MMPRWLLRLALTVLVTCGALAPMAAGCGDGDSLVGGDCASGYAPCGTLLPGEQRRLA